MDLLPFRIAFALIFLLAFAVVARYRRQAQRGESFSLEEEGAWLVIPLRLGGLALWLYPFVFILAPSLLAWSFVELPAGLRWLGAALAVVTIPLIAWAQRTLGRNVSPTVITRKEHDLVTAGPYRYVRHPLYSLGFLFFSSLALLAASWFLAVAIVLGFGLIALRTPKEEAMLRQRFGADYEAYAARTGRYLPRLGRA